MAAISPLHLDCRLTLRERNNYAVLFHIGTTTFPVIPMS